jgi:dTDP-4-dehydrorhamnose reductase
MVLRDADVRMTRWLVAGAGGMLGADVVATLRAAGHDPRTLTKADLDVRSGEGCQRAVAGVDVVVNAAAWTDVDGAEDQEGEAFAVNAVGAANLARACAAIGAVLVHVSTDYVFAGNASQPYRVDEPLRPINAYGRTKAAGEWAVRSECPASYVVRTAWLYGANGRCFPRTILRLATEKEELDVVDDQRGQPTWTGDLAAHLHDLVAEEKPFGTYHGTASGETTWWGLARAVLMEAGLDPERVRPARSSDFPRAAARPAYSVLENQGVLPDWSDGLRRALPSLMADR